MLTVIQNTLRSWSLAGVIYQGPNTSGDEGQAISPADLIFSFVDTRIQAIGIAQSYCWESPKPLEFGTASQNWEDIGWKVQVAFTALATKIRPKDHIDILRPLLRSDTRPCSRTEIKLTTRYFGTGTRGFAASEDASVAVCVLPGTELSFAEKITCHTDWSVRLASEGSKSQDSDFSAGQQGKGSSASRRP